MQNAGLCQLSDSAFLTGSSAGAGETYGYTALSQVALGAYVAALTTALSHFQLQQEIEADNSYGLVHLAIAQMLAAQPAELEGVMGSLTPLTQLAVTPVAYFEAALAAATPQPVRLHVLMAYGRFLGQRGQAEAARARLEEAQALAQASQLTHKLHHIEALLQSLV